MSLKVVRKKVNTVPPIDGGTYAAVCVGIIDIGEQKENYGDQKTDKYAGKIILLYEIPAETVEIDGEQKPRWLSKEYTASLSEKSNLYKHILQWRGQVFTEEELSEDGGFELSTMLGKPCMLSVSLVKKEDSGAYNKVDSVVGYPRGMPEPTTETELLLFDIDNRDEEVFAKIPEWIQKKIKESTQYTKELPDERLDVDTGETADNTSTTGEKKEVNPI